MTSRTDGYEDTLRQIEMLRNQSIAARTVMRAYLDYAAEIGGRTFGALGDHAQDDLINFAEQRADRFRRKAIELTERADQLEQGIS